MTSLKERILEVLNEARIKKVVNRRGKITKKKTAGRKGMKIDASGKKKVIGGLEKRAKRMGSIKRRRTLKRKSSYQKRKSAKFASMGRKRRASMNVRDTRKG